MHDDFDEEKKIDEKKIMHDDGVGGSLLNLDVKASQSWEQRGYLSRERYAIHLWITLSFKSLYISCHIWWKSQDLDCLTV